MGRLRILVLLAGAPLIAQQYIISTIAGETHGGPVLNNPTSVAANAAGDVYFADWSGLIRKIWARDRSISAVAGVGITGYSGDGGQATAAKIGKAIALALDGAGNLYIADGDNNRIRRVEESRGIITTIAGTGASVDSGDGGPGIRAGVARPTGITVNENGDVYFSSSWSRVRKLLAASGVIETVAGQFYTSFSGDNGPATDAEFSDPIPRVFPHTGDLYIADYENSRIRMVAKKTGIVNTVAGSSRCALSPPPFVVMVCQGGFGGDGGPATKAALNHAQAVALDAAGNLFIADTINHRIRRVDAATGVISTIAGTGANGFSGDGGPAAAAQISFPAGIAVDALGRVYFSDENNQRIRMLTPIPQRSQSPGSGATGGPAGANGRNTPRSWQ